MTRVRYGPDEYSLRVEGHAGAGSAGADLVCAALSILAMTLERHVTQNETLISAVSREPGRLTVRCYPGRGQKGLCREMLSTVYDGYALLAENCPKYVSAEKV
ncbi:MAG: ribosomal-processing cysteine protease Prp [Candidatus Limivicinus sp.]|nr:ribosomal-processing cysteine protease Prp [Candidatus Limivicinus sp.]